MTETHHHTFWYLFKNGFYHGLGWSFGATIGLAMISSLLVIVLNLAGGLPLIGHWIANIVESTQYALLNRTPILSR